MYTDQSMQVLTYEKSIEILSDAARGIITFNQDFKDALKIAIKALQADQLNLYSQPARQA